MNASTSFGVAVAPNSSEWEYSGLPSVGSATTLAHSDSSSEDMLQLSEAGATLVDGPQC